MSNNTITPMTSTQRHNDILSSLASQGANAATIMMATEILYVGEQSNEGMKKIQNTRKVREQISNRIEELTKHRAKNFKGDKFSGTPLDGNNKDKSVKDSSEFTFELNSETGEVNTTKVGTFDSTKKEQVDAEIQRLQGDMQSLDSQREIDQMMLQDIMGRKQRLITMATNLSQTEHQSHMSVIRNLRG